MKIDINKKLKNKIELEIEIPAEQMNNYFQSAARELSKDIKINGFRPGKVPVDIVEREIGSQKLYDQAANLAVSRTLPEAILNNDLRIIGKPEIIITQIARNNSIKYKAIFFTIPEIKLGEYKNLKIKKKEVKIEDKEVKQSLEQLQNARAKLKAVNRGAKKGDNVEINFATRINGVKIEGGESEKHPIILGQGKFIPGFEEKLEGMKAGEEKKFSLTAPKNWPQEKLAGKSLEFEVKVESVQKRELPELSDEFAKSLGKFSSLKALEESIKKGLRQEKDNREKERIRMELIDKIVKNSKIEEIPQDLINAELDKMINELKGNIANMGLEFDKYLKQVNKSIEDLKKEWQNQAEKRVKISLALEEIAKKESIEITNQEVEEKINKELQHYPNIEEIKKQVDFNALKDYTKSIIRNQKTFEFLERKAKII